jgi:RHS repeat-associated protein
MLAPAEHERMPSPLPLDPRLTEDLGPVVMADDPCEAALSAEDPAGPRKYYRARYYDPALGRFTSEDRHRPGDGFAQPYAYVDNNPILKVDPLGLFSMMSRDAASIPQYKWNAIYGETRAKCCKLDKIITDPTLRDNVKKSCDSGTINVSNRCPPGVAGGPTDITWGTFLSWFGGGVRTITVCANNWDETMKDWEGPGNVSIHEWAHGCGWWHNGGKGVPGQNGRDVHSPY